MDITNASILVIDDDQDVLLAARVLLKRFFSEVCTESDPRQLPPLLKKKKHQVVLLDMNFTLGNNSGKEGLFWLKKIRELDPHIGIVMMTAYAEIELAVESISQGAADFVEKPWNDYKLVQTIRKTLQLRQMETEVCELKQQQKGLLQSLNRNELLVKGPSPRMQQIYHTLEKIADVEANVLILGENGTGKEVIAKEIHRLSGRASAPFISIDMGSVHENLFESELFGHSRGAFTDAKNDKSGKFVIANGGTLFLDEIGNIAPSLQAKLLSAIQNRMITPVGSVNPISIDVRIICATNKPLYQMVSEGSFREDLLFRINTIEINLPSLAERKEDIPVLAKHYFEKYCEKYNKPHLQMAESTRRHLTLMKWPGNIRQLRHTIESSVILADQSTLLPKHIQYRITPTTFGHPHSMTLEENERNYIQITLQKLEGNISKTADSLGIARSTLYQKMNRYGL